MSNLREESEYAQTKYRDDWEVTPNAGCRSSFNCPTIAAAGWRRMWDTGVNWERSDPG